MIKIITGLTENIFFEPDSDILILEISRTGSYVSI